ncbi:hypothetical protein THASP1DRAFT_21396 [Thamnocephalis sphaerospora]|uniref:Homeodomain-like protein n=1 Tax=Thamnocephalis sphaerospora TaxID=78915 RepID=A0A4P9XXB7_9FUNG|nr:hypothetical protein THASP1DRAFT_21396 [Thamnocephalis sphaerospora]|eukprot:RKP10947.1 hypothetical protein THASP1DRAFT_21396 [Thamnocephalis sphaerospora]
MLREELGAFGAGSLRHFLPAPYFDGDSHERLVIHRPRKFRLQNHEFLATERMLASAPLAAAQLSDEEVEREHRFLPHMDWKRVATGFLPGRSPIECMIRWVSHDHPMINKRSWSIEEDAMLRNIARKHDEHDWEKIALELGTNRTSWQCFKQYRSHLWEELGRRKWTPEEDVILTKAIAMYGERNWQQVAACFDNRTGQQCLHRWTKTLKPGKRKGRWSTAEDEVFAKSGCALINAFALNGANNWVKVAAHVPGRTDVQCRERWTNVLDPDVRRDPWEKSEDDALLRLVAKFGTHRWASVSRDLGTKRTDNQLRAAGVVPHELLESSPYRASSEQTRARTHSSEPPLRPLQHPTNAPSVANKWTPRIKPASSMDALVPVPTDALPPHKTRIISPLPMLLGTNGRHAKFWLTNTMQNMKITKRKRYPETDSIIPLAPSEATTVSLARAVSHLHIKLDTPDITAAAPSTLEPALAARIEASPGLRLLSERLDAVYAWSMLIGQTRT